MIKLYHISYSIYASFHINHGNRIMFKTNTPGREREEEEEPKSVLTMVSTNAWAKKHCVGGGEIKEKC